MKNMLLLVICMTFTLSAAFVPVDRAKVVAKNQYNRYCADANTKGTTIVNVVENLYEGEITWYAFEFEKGFVIVSADDAVRPILGYSDHGKIPSADKPGGENFKEWFTNYDKQIAYARKNNIVEKTGREAWKKIESNEFSSSKAGIIVDRLVRSEWDQCWPFNAKCPVVDGVQSFTGCPATAAAQVLRYHQVPVGEGFNEVDFSTHTWDYSKMPYIVDFDYGIYPEFWYGESLSQEIVDELALMSYWVGLSLDTDYNIDGIGSSSSSVTAIVDAFLNNWKASSSENNNYFAPNPGVSDPDYSTIKFELDNNRPWLWTGNGDAGGHAFLLDGYTDDYWYHFNWGWGGDYDGWFDRRILIVEGSGGGWADPVDFTSTQTGTTYVPQVDSFIAWPATTVSGSVANGEDITIDWTAQTGAEEYSLYRTYEMQAVPSLITTTTSLSFTDIDLPLGEYAYHVIVTYPTGDSHNSNTYSYTISVVGDYIPPTDLNGSAVGRTSIDLDWVKPDGGSIEPDGYDIYRNGLFAATVSGATNVTWSDTGFDDGDNSYYVRALYPSSNVSVPSNNKTINIDANPKPGYLTGTFDGANTNVDLEWYQPYMNPTRWYSYYDVTTSTATIDKPWEAAPLRRVKFGTDLGYNYPVTIDSVGAYFYQWPDKPWSTDKFAIRIVALGYEALPDTTLWEALNQTAIPGEFFTIELPAPIVRTKGWAVEIEAEGTTTGDPGNLVGPTPDGNVHSFFYNTLISSYDSFMLTAGVPAEYAILTHFESAEEPPIAKAFQSYNVYRNTVFLGNTTNKYFTDTDPTGDNNYYVTAVYDIPTGESEGSNIINVSPPATISLPVSIGESVAPGTSATRSFNITNSGAGVLNYDISFEYVDPLSEEFTPIDNAFATGLDGFVDGGVGTSWIGGTYTYKLDGTPYAYCVAASGGTATIRTLTTPSFDGSNCETLSFDHASIVSNASSNFIVEYSINDGGNYTQLYSATTVTGGWGDPDHQEIILPSVSTTMKIRFTATLEKRTDDVIGLDNVLVHGTNVIIDPWFSLVSPVSASVAASSNFDFDCGYDATTLIQDSVYHVNITITSNDPANPSVVIPVTLTVQDGGLESPTNVITNISEGYLVITWNNVSGATSYNVYSSDDPYGIFSLDLSGSFNFNGEEWTIAADQAKMFYYIKASDAKTIAPKTIKVANTKK